MQTGPNRLNDIPLLIKFVRKHLRNMTRDDLAAKLKTTSEVIYNLENGRTALTAERKVAIFNVLQINTAEMRLFFIAQLAKDAK